MGTQCRYACSGLFFVPYARSGMHATIYARILHECCCACSNMQAGGDALFFSFPGSHMYASLDSMESGF